MSLRPRDPLPRRPKRNRDAEKGDTLLGDDDKHSKKRRVEEQEGSETHKLFACPYYKRCPTRWDKPPCRSREGWKSVARLKQHLRETHFKQICQRCRALFESEAELKAHGVAREGCTPREETDYIRGFGASIHEKLRSRKMGKNISQFEYWQKVYTTLFPDVSSDNVPSPYCMPFNVHDWFHQCRDHRGQDDNLKSRLNDITSSGSPIDIIVDNILAAIDDSDLSLIRMVENEGFTKKAGSCSIKSDTSLGTHTTKFGGNMDGHTGQDDGQVIKNSQPPELAGALRVSDAHPDSFGLQMLGSSGALALEQPSHSGIYSSHGFIDPSELQIGFTHILGNSHGGQNGFHPQSEGLAAASQAQNTDTMHLQYPPASVQGSFLPLLQDDCHHRVSETRLNVPTGRTMGLVPRQEAIAEVNQAFSKYNAAFKDGHHNI